MSERQATDILLRQHVFEPRLSLSRYQPFIGQDAVDCLMRLAEPLANASWAHVNSTYDGGGVAEMLRSLVPLARSLGIDTRWNAIDGHAAFFQVTKKFHNMLQGVAGPVTLEELFETYLENIHAQAIDLGHIAADLVVVHDPQPAALVTSGVFYGNVLWRCHIDTSAPNPTIWRFLLPYLNQYAGAIFTMRDFVGPGLQVPTYQISPCIDPLAEKNRLFSDDESLQILGPLFDDENVDPARPILAAVSRYDMHKNQATILKAFKALRREKTFNPPPYLIFLGNTSIDDPEAEAMLQTLREEAEDDPDVRFWVNVENNDQVVGALMQIARGLVHVSTKEGFGLVVSEALWQATPVIGSNIGGITQQVVDAENGFVVDPMDVESIAAKMAYFIERPDEADAMGAHGREHVRRHFLLPELLGKYLLLLRHYTGVDKEEPVFRLNGRAYSEIIDVLRSKRRLMDLMPDLHDTVQKAS